MTTINLIKNPVNFIVLAGQRSPGIATVKGADSPRKWDQRGGYGLIGATAVFHGRKLSEFTVDLVLSEDADWDAWNAWKHLVLAPPSEIQSDPNSILRPTAIRPRALDIEHPILADLGIRSVVIENCSQPEQTADGQWTISIKMLEFHRPHFTVARPTGSAATPVDPVDAQIEGLTRQVQALSGESGDSH